MKIRATVLERLVVGAAAALFVAGCLMGYYVEPVWLNRFGSLIIALGVVLAIVQVASIMDDQIGKFLAKNRESQVQLVLEQNRSFFGGTLPPGFEEKLREGIDKQVNDVFAAYKKRRVDRFKKVEIGVLVGGTLTNGFGDWVIRLFQQAAVACS